MLTKRPWTISLTLLAMTSLTVGCAGETGPAQTAQNESHDDHDHAEGKGGAHDGWWCVEHGVPEGECTRCDSTLIAAFKEKGDWCREHDLPESQCFKCNPKRAETFIARYEARYGEKPPAPTE